ncbi:L,D-transpeptidase [Mycobacterium sp. 29Ha]|uniref:L,D-transpeptidase n=1 Tax=Mycobacterium sp. 29Ha TaxID=2939268 RepID=UPI002938EF67|nr:L,D-transpeptidase [Mycobacterium sp. 29Ha]MDV3131345.1 L,D-transpeptidase [Mycobacterium sp. 29Ha]
MRCPPLRPVVAMLTSLFAAMTLLTAMSASAQPPVPVPAPGDPLAIPAPTASDPFMPSLGSAPTAAADPPAGQNPAPYLGPPVFAPPTFNPVNGSIVGVAKPIIINFQRSIADRPLAEQAVHVSSNPPVPGKFYWMSATQLRWRPIDFWPANTTVTIDAGGTKSSFRTGDALVATIDNATLQMEVMRNGVLEKTIPVSLGKPGYETPNGTYYVLEKFADMVMDSSTYGVPIDSAEGYKLKVKDAVRINNAGIFVHGAPWSVADQGKRNVSHGCPNLSPANAQWFYDTFGSGDPVVVKNSLGVYNENDGAQDWQI